MAENNIKLIAINPYGQLTYTLESPDAENVKLKKAQYELSENNLGIKISKEIIISKMKNQKATLITLNKNKQQKRVYNHRLKIDECISQLDNLTLSGRNESLKMAIMGLEGKASNEYWAAIKYFVPNNSYALSGFLSNLSHQSNNSSILIHTCCVLMNLLNIIIIILFFYLNNII